MLLLGDAEYSRPKSITEVLNALEKFGRDSSLLAGGTDLVLSIKHGAIRPKAIIDLGGIQELRIIEIRNGELHIGSTATFSVLLSSTLIEKHAPALQAAIFDIGSPQIRNVGTIGGNIATASPAGDCLPALTAHEAHVVLATRTGERRVELSEFFKGKLRQPQITEFITEVIIPVGAETVQGAFVKVGRRNALTIARISAALVIWQNPDKIIKKARFVLGAIGKLPVRVPDAEALICGGTNKQNLLERVAEFAADAVRQSIPGRPTLPYKERAIRGVVYEIIEKVLNG